MREGISFSKEIPSRKYFRPILLFFLQFEVRPDILEFGFVIAHVHDKFGVLEQFIGDFDGGIILQRFGNIFIGGLHGASEKLGFSHLRGDLGIQQEIDEKIGVNERNITHSLQEIHFLREDLKARGTANERLYKVIKDKEIAESKLPEIESKKDLLIQELTRRYEELQSYNEKIDEYNRLVKEAEEINERIQNNNY